MVKPEDLTDEQRAAMDEDADRQLAETLRHMQAVEDAGQAWLASR